MAMTGDAAVALTPGREVRRPLVIAASLALVVIAAVAALFIVQGVDAQMQDIQRTHETRRQARDLVQALTDAETGQRGYLLTLDEAYLEPYREAVASMDETFRALNEMLVDRPTQRLRVAGVSDLIEQKRAEMAMTISMAMEGRLSEGLSILRSDAGRSLMESIRTGLAAVVADEDERLFERNEQVAGMRTWLISMIIVALGGAVVLTYALLARTQRAFSLLSRNATELRSQKLELERRVQERTAELEEARTHAERERARVEALLQDTNHRIGNSLATVSSLLGLQMTRSQSPEVRDALEAAQNRVQAIASGHRRLRLGADLETTEAAEFITAVVDDLKATQVGDRVIRFDTEIAPLTINARDATTLGIIVGELVVNALKHAFAPGASGRVLVRLRPMPEGLALDVEDDGRGLPDGDAPQGLGAVIIEQLSRQYGGEVRRERPEAGGTRVTILLPRFEIVADQSQAMEPDGRSNG